MADGRRFGDSVRAVCSGGHQSVAGGALGD